MTNDAPTTERFAGALRPLRWSTASMSGSWPVDGDFVLPAGTVTFLLTDVEGSTASWERAPSAMGPAIARHYEILDSAVGAHGGVRPQEQGEGDSIVAAFGRASDAVLAALDAQRALSTEPWPAELRTPLRVRMAIHTGEAQLRDEANYVGQTIIRTARLRAIAHGGQVLVSQAVRDLMVDHLGDRIELIDLGTHRLKDLARPERVWQVAGDGLAREFPPLRSLDAVPNNLPTELSTFVGRQTEIASLCALMKGNRLVTITGSGGAGKTRLAQQAAAQVTDDHPDGTWWIELAPIDASQVRSKVAAAVSITEPARLVERLAGRMLLVLDNCEHVLDTVAPLAHQILAACPDVSVLATSRSPLDVPGEVTWRVPPLAVPNGKETVSIERLAQFDAVQLFVDRARRARPNFVLTNDNGPSVAELCSRLDGIPLAIELAAARAKSLTAEQILSGLADALRLLTGGSRLVMPRQQTLEASIAWSHELLGDRERMLFRRLAAFAGGWDLEAAEAICADSALPAMAVLDCLEHLIDQSLVRVDEARGAARYEMLETVRQFAARLLADHADEAHALPERHGDWYARLAAEVGPLVETREQDAAVAALAADRSNLAAALRRLQMREDGDKLGRMVVDCSAFWDVSDTPAEGRTWTTAALDVLGERNDALAARLLEGRARMIQRMGTMHPTEDLDRALAIAERTGDRRTAGRVRVMLAQTVGLLDLAAAIQLIRSGIEDSRAAEDHFNVVLAAYKQAWLHLFRGEDRQLREVVAAGEPLIRGFGVRTLLHQLNSYRCAVWMHEADHQHMALMGDPASESFVRAEATRLLGQVLFTGDHGDEGPSTAHLEERTRYYLRIENHYLVMTSAIALIVALRIRDRNDEACEAADRGRALLPRLALWPSFGAVCALAAGDLDRARAYLATYQSMAASAGLNVRLEANVAEVLLARHDGELATAETVVHERLALAVEHGYVREIVDSLELLAGLAVAQGSWVNGARLAGAAFEQRETHPLRARIEPIRSILAADVATARSALGDSAFDSAFAEGRRLTRDDAVAYAQRMRGERARPTLGWRSLTPTERRVADLARLGRSNAAIAVELLMGAETVKTHLSRIYAKLGFANRTQLAAFVPPAD